MKTSIKSILNLFFTITLCFIVASCNKKTEVNPIEGQTASDFLPSDVKEFGEKLNVSFDSHIAAIQKLGSTASISEIMKASHDVHVDHFGSSHQINDEHLDKLASNVSNQGQWITISDSLINSMDLSRTGKQLIYNLGNIVSYSTTHDEFQGNLMNFAKELQSMTLPSSELKYIQHKVVALEHSMRHIHENLQTLPGNRTTGYLGCVGRSALGGLVGGAVTGAIVGSEAPLVGTIAGACLGALVGGVAGGVTGGVFSCL